MKALLCFRSGVLCFCFFVIFVSCSLLDEACAASKKNGASPLRISYLPNGDVFYDTYNEQKYLKDFFAIVGKYIPHSPVFVPTKLDFSSTENVFTEYDTQVGAFVAKTPERMFKMKFSKYPISTTHVYLVTGNDKKVYHNDVRSLNGKSVAINLENSEAKNMLDSYLLENNISMQYKIYKKYSDYIQSDADFHLLNSFHFIKGKQVSVFIGEQDFYFVAPQQYTAYLDILDAAIEQAKKHDTVALESLFLKHISTSKLLVQYEYGEEGLKMVEHPRKVAEVAFATNHYPIQYVSEHGEPMGVTMEIINIFKQMHENPTKYRPYTPESSVDVRVFDMLFTLVGDREAKEKYFYASKPYAHLPMVIFERKELDTTSAKVRFGMMDYTTLNIATVQAAFPHWEMQVFTNFEAMLNAYANEEIDAVFLSDAEAQYAMAHLGMRESSIEPTTFTLPLQFYLSKVYPVAALDVLNAFIDKLSPVAVQGAIMKAEHAVRNPSTMQEFIFEYKTSLSIALLAALIVLCMLYVFKVRSEKRTLRKIINTDTLTGLSSKEYAYEMMQSVLKKANPGEYTIITMDIDRFSLLNQVYGREKSDAVLCLLAKIITNIYAAKHETECIARLRDDVFFVLIKTKNRKADFDPTECKMNAIYGVKEILQSDYTISLSLGVCVIDDVHTPVETLVDYCNTARHKGKHAHGLSVTTFTSDMKQRLEAEKRIIYNMEQALDNNEFILHFQPKVDLASSQICGAEVLVRWQPQNAPPIYPDDFISVFEDNAFIAKLDMYVFENTCKFINEHRRSYFIPPLAVNLSGISILHDDTYSYIQRYMQEYKISPQEIEIEITESALVAESETFFKAIDALRGLGFNIAIDDFGTGVSSLHRLSSLRVDVVKLDKAFLDDKLTQKKGILLVASMISMLHRLEMKVIAEGVETERHVMILKKMHCDIAQGYYFYKPLSEEDFLYSMNMGNYVTKENPSYLRSA